MHPLAVGTCGLEERFDQLYQLLPVFVAYPPGLGCLYFKLHVFSAP